MIVVGQVLVVAALLGVLVWGALLWEAAGRMRQEGRSLKPQNGKRRHCQQPRDGQS